MKLFKKDSSAEDSAKAKPQKSKSAMPNLLVGLIFAGLLPIAAATGALFQLYFVDHHNASMGALKEKQLQQTTSNLDNSLANYQKRLEAIASREEIVQLVASNPSINAPEVTALAQWLGKLFPFGKSFRIIPNNSIKEVETVGDFPIRYSALDLIRRSVRAKEPASEAIKLDNKWYISLTYPVYNNDQTKITGVLFLALESNAFLEPLAGVVSGNGAVSVTQKFDDAKPQVFLAAGGKINAAHAISKPLIGNPLWSVEYSISPQLVETLSLNPELLAFSIGGAFVGYLVLVVLIYLRFSKQLKANYKLLGNQLEATITGKPEKDPQFDFPELGHILAAVNVLKPRSSSDMEFLKKSLAEDEDPSKNLDTTDPKLSDPLFQNSDILDIDVNEDDQDLLGLSEELSGSLEGDLGDSLFDSPEANDDEISRIYRAYDIRGVFGAQLTDSYALQIGLALGSEVIDSGNSSIIVAADGRTSSPVLSAKLIQGILATGCDVINIGTVTSPVMYYATHTLSTNCGVCVTASHNAAEYNGFKIVINGKSMFDDDLLKLKSRIDSQNFHNGQGNHSEQSVTEDYIEKICSDVALADSVKVVIDCGNGVAGAIAPQLFEELGCEVLPLHCDLDGNFPNHPPDPSRIENLYDLMTIVESEKADIGLAFDGDGDRIGVVTPNGNVILPDRLLMLFAKDIVSRNPGTDVLFDVKCTRRLNSVISSYGGRPVMCQTGHSFMKKKMIETGALLGGELSGHIFFKERWYGFDDGIYAAARLLEILTIRDQDIDSAFEAFPDDVSTPEILIPIEDDRKFNIIEQLNQQADFGDGKITNIDGIRIDFSDGWGLVRASNTTPALTLRFEAENDQALNRIKDLIRTQLRNVDDTLDLSY